MRWTLLALLAGCGAAPRATPGDPGGNVVVLISLDGMRHDYPSRVETPIFDRLAREGATADRLIPPFPSQTFSAHATLATGATAEHHGILNNRFKDRERGLFAYDDEASWYDRPPLWIHATRHGVRSHVFHWIGNNGSYQGVAAAEVRLFDKGITDDSKVETILGWLRAKTPPRLVMSYFAGCDKPGHELGPDAWEVTECVAEKDATLGELVAGIEALPYPVTLVLVSDHGMMKTQGEIDLYTAFEALDFGVDIVASGPVAHAFMAPENRPAAETLAKSLPHLTAWRRDEVPQDLAYSHPSRTGDLLLLADYGWHFNARKGGMLPGHHGHDPTRPQMGAIFYAWGHGVRPGARLVQPRAVDIAPTICRLLGIPGLAEADGAPLTGLLLE